ncbi:PH domain-containing protein [Oceanobacillus jeddahense]|uniref:PH domain-containing protein n=1 Tax=Oceanobacillus jeddahense TaxID=1462527 RepID=UPI0005960C2A|nr:PH domain-containing protein [Oceanobacillus jeddahense]
MNHEKRYHPLLMLYDVWRLIKNMFFLFLFLFVIRANSDFWLFTYGRFAIVLLFLFILLAIPMRWLTSKFKIGNKNLQLNRRFLITSSRTIPYATIQHTRQKATLFHRMFHMTSLTLETSTTGGNSTIIFHVLKQEEVQEIEKYIREKKDINISEHNDEENLLDPASENVQTDKDKANRVVHFSPTAYDIFKASLASFSFIAVFPIAWSLMSNFIQLFSIGGKVEDVFTDILGSWPWWVMLIFLILMILVAIAAGGVLTIYRYGKYEITSDFEKIYITQRFSERTTFSISKVNVQAVHIHQSVIKRILGLAEIKLICAGSTGREDAEVNRLYPFLPVQRAYTMVEEMLPSYQVTSVMNRLPKNAWWIQMLKPSWFWIIATGFLYYVKPDFLGLEVPWWILSILMFILIMVSRLLYFYQTRYTINKSMVQFKTGGFNTSVFLSTKNKVVELQLTRHIVQQKLGLASIVISNHAKPVMQTKINNLPIGWCEEFSRWYMAKELSK